jgi:type VI secretion system protein ImpC
MMPKPISFGKIDFEIVALLEETRGVPDSETPFRSLIMGDFSGRTNRGIFDTADIAKRKPLLVDRDNFDEVIKKLGVEIRLPIFGKDSPVTIRFSELDDFHPDHLFENLEVFQTLRDMRRSLKDPSLFSSLAKEFQRKIEKPPVEKIAGETKAEFFEQVLKETEEEPMPEAKRNRSEWDEFLHKIVSPHLVPDIEPKQTEMIATVDRAISELMRMILHHPDFQALEAAWRGIHFLASRIDTGADLKLYLLDISKAEMAADLMATEDLRSTGIYKLLVEQTVETPGAEPWAVLSGNYTFDHSREDAELLGRMAKIAGAAGAPFIAAASDRLLGCESLAQTPDPKNWKRMTDTEANRAWEALRKLPDASHLGLALPRFLLRLPYGTDTVPIENFDFEETEAESLHDHYLWGNPCFACVFLLAQAFSEAGWDLRPGIIQDIEDLPLHVYEEQGESLTKPCAEVLLTERAVEKILEKGIMPIVSFKNRDMIRLARFQSISDPPTVLSGRWIKKQG